MNQQQAFIIHVVVEIIILIAVFIYFKTKMSVLTAQVNNLQNIVLHQQDIINRHEKIISQMLGIESLTIPPLSMNNNSMSNATNVEVQHSKPPPPPPSSPPNLMPMVQGLMGMLGSVGSMNSAFPSSVVSEKPSVNKSIDVDAELEKELKELKEVEKGEEEEKEEGRVDEEEILQVQED